jgi:hypothetical protein
VPSSICKMRPTRLTASSSLRNRPSNDNSSPNKLNRTPNEYVTAQQGENRPLNPKSLFYEQELGPCNLEYIQQWSLPIPTRDSPFYLQVMRSKTHNKWLGIRTQEFLKKPRPPLLWQRYLIWCDHDSAPVTISSTSRLRTPPSNNTNPCK